MKIGTTVSRSHLNRPIKRGAFGPQAGTRSVVCSIVICLTTMTFGLTAAADSVVERGAYLVNTIMASGNCHTPLGPDGPMASKALAGRFLEKNPSFTAYASNITPAGPSGNWSDQELKTAIREGLRPDGSIIGPPMPYQAYRGISDSDLDAIVAYLRSIPAVENELPASEYAMALPAAYGPPVDFVPAPDPEDTLAVGKYLATTWGTVLSVIRPIRQEAPMSGKGRAKAGLSSMVPGEHLSPATSPSAHSSATAIAS